MESSAPPWVPAVGERVRILMGIGEGGEGSVVGPADWMGDGWLDVIPDGGSVAYAYAPSMIVAADAPADCPTPGCPFWAGHEGECGAASGEGEPEYYANLQPQPPSDDERSLDEHRIANAIRARLESMVYEGLMSPPAAAPPEPRRLRGFTYGVTIRMPGPLPLPASHDIELTPDGDIAFVHGLAPDWRSTMMVVDPRYAMGTRLRDIDRLTGRPRRAATPPAQPDPLDAARARWRRGVWAPGGLDGFKAARAFAAWCGCSPVDPSVAGMTTGERERRAMGWNDDAASTGMR